MSNEQRIKEIEKEFTKLGIIESVPIIMLGLGLHAKFGRGNEPIFEFLKNDAVVNVMLLVAAPVVLWCTVKAIQLAFERKRLEENTNP